VSRDLLTLLEIHQMRVVKVVVWEEDGAWLGYLQEYPDYWTQGETLEDLREHLKDLYHELTSEAGAENAPA
jgi:predicted RNase H-like HicB family nuclease